MTLRKLGSLAARTFSSWSEHDAQTLGAALSYYTVLSLAPLLVIAISIAGLVFGHKAAQGEIVSQVTSLVGPSGADAIQTMLAHARSPKAGIIATIIGFIVLFFSAGGVFTELRLALNRIWDVRNDTSSGLWGMMKNEFFSFAMIVGMGFLLLVSLIISTVLAAIGKFVGGYMPVGLFRGANWIFSLIVITLVFAAIYRVVPERTLPWRGLWIGSFATAVLFTLGKFLLGLYLGKASIGSAYGAAGSLVVLFVWVYYSAQIFLLGAEFTRLYACETGVACLNVKKVPGEDTAPQPVAKPNTSTRPNAPTRPSDPDGDHRRDHDREREPQLHV